MAPTFNPDDPDDLVAFCKDILAPRYRWISVDQCTRILAEDESLYGDLAEKLRTQDMSDDVLEKASAIHDRMEMTGGTQIPPASISPLPALVEVPSATVEAKIDVFRDRLRPVLENFIGRQQSLWCPAMSEPDFLWFKAQEFPNHGGKPDLLLHPLGSFATDPALRAELDEIFLPDAEGHTFVVNTSGAGKTRLMFEGLCLHWGLYFAAVVDSSSIGSFDVGNTIHHYVPETPGFVTNLSTASGPTQYVLSLRHNRRIAEMRFCEVLLARLIIFRLFIEIIKDRTDVVEPKKLWLLLQIRPRRAGFSGGDFFDRLVQELRNSPPLWVRKQVTEHMDAIRSWCHGPGYGTAPFFLVLDEAQHAARNHFSAFRSQKEESVYRPILREIVHAWVISFFRALGLWMVISGTGIDMDVIEKVLASAVFKPDDYRSRSNQAAFATKLAHETFIRQYIPHRILATPSGIALLERMLYWLHGRHRFTTAFLSELLAQRFQSPHRLLNSFVKRYTGITPTDGESWVEESGGEWPEALQLNTFDFSKLAQYPEMETTIRNTVSNSRIRSGYSKHLTPDERLFVEYGFARYVEHRTDKVVFDEPLVLLAAETELGRASWYSDRMDTNSPDVNGWEDYLAFSLPLLFATKPRLDQVFDFAGVSHTWSKRKVELVSLHQTESSLEPEISPVLPNKRPHFSHGATPGNSTHETVEWLEHRSTTFILFPPKGMGPDLMFVLRVVDGPEQGSLLWVALQAKYSEVYPRLSTEVLRKAIRSATPAKYWIQKNGKAHAPKGHKGLPKQTLTSLERLPRRLDHAGEQSVLRVIAAFPAPAALERAAPWTKGTLKDVGDHPLASLDRAFLAQATHDLYPPGKLASMMSRFDGEAESVPESDVEMDSDESDVEMNSDESGSEGEVGDEAGASSSDVDMPMAGPSRPTPRSPGKKTTGKGKGRATSGKGTKRSRGAAKSAKGSAMGSVKGSVKGSVMGSVRGTPAPTRSPSTRRGRGRDVAMTPAASRRTSPSVSTRSMYSLRSRNVNV
ncbi:hypothetical protein C8R46DRAFT_1014362 [Mycena filopes]|nr:hypothetical protein C8R46DRAFT_1014362 [Mycena filopes]